MPWPSLLPKMTLRSCESQSLAILKTVSRLDAPAHIVDIWPIQEDQPRSTRDGRQPKRKSHQFRQLAINDQRSGSAVPVTTRRISGAVCCGFPSNPAHPRTTKGRSMKLFCDEIGPVGGKNKTAGAADNLDEKWLIIRRLDAGVLVTAAILDGRPVPTRPRFPARQGLPVSADRGSSSPCKTAETTPQTGVKS